MLLLWLPQLSSTTPSKLISEAEVATPANASRWGPPEDKISGTVVVVSGRPTDADWLSAQPYPFVIMTKGLPEGTPNNLVINKGREASSYLQFIVENYHDLPPRMVFLHGHNASWHLKV